MQIKMMRPTSPHSIGTVGREIWKILKATMALLSMLPLTAQTSLQQFLRGDQVDGWELFCAPRKLVDGSLPHRRFENVQNQPSRI